MQDPSPPTNSPLSMIELDSNQSAFFVSDLHLSEETTVTLETFERWLASVSTASSIIFLLGDVFETWCGDDDQSDFTLRVREALRQSTLAGSKLYFIHGNRDFLLGDEFANDFPFEILPDPEFLKVGKHIILLSHGDSLCTDDKAYQKFRAESRTDAWRDNFLSNPLPVRQQIARHMRQESKKHTSAAHTEIMDVNPEAVAAAFNGRWPDGSLLGPSDVIVHGHTHRCAAHLRAKGKTQSGQESWTGHLEKDLRLVLPDWAMDDSSRKNSAKGGHLEIRADGTYSMQLIR